VLGRSAVTVPEETAGSGGVDLGGALVHDVGLELAGSLNLRRAVLRLLNLLQPRFADWVMLAMPDPGHDRLSLYGGRDPQFTANLRSDLSVAPVLDEVLRFGRADVLQVSHHDSPHHDGGDSPLAAVIPHSGLRREAQALQPADVLTVPLTARGGVVGALVSIRGAGAGFTPRDVEIAEQVAQRAAVALDAAHVYEDLAEVGSVLEASLRPPTLPDLPGVSVSASFRPAAEHLEIGGDFYDVHGPDDDCLVVLGDVCGKGVHAAVLNGRARQSIRTAAHFDRRPGKILATLDRVLYEAHSDRFVTVVCARVRPRRETGALTVDVAVAGHPAPLLLRVDGTVDELEVSGRLAGVLPGEPDFKEVTVELERGETMLLFSDGIYEARSPTGSYGFDRLKDKMRPYAGADPHVLCQAIEQDVVEYLDGHGHDDMTLLALSGKR